MIELFNTEFKDKINKKYKGYIYNLIISISIYITIFIFMIIFHNQIKKELFVTLLTIITTILLLLLYISIKSIQYYKELLKLINNKFNYEFDNGILNPLDTYNITIKGLTYKQYKLKGEDNQKTIYVLNGINIDILLNKKIKVYLLNNILYAYEVLNEQSS